MKHFTQFLSYLVAGFILMLALTYFLNQSARASDIVCESAFKNKVIHIKDHQVSFLKSDELGPNRKISSLDNIRTEKKHKGFIKILQHEGLKHRIRIKEVGAFSELEDSLKITNNKGHEITYPLSCKLI